MRKFFRRLAAAAGAAAFLVMGSVGYFQAKIPDSFYVTEGDELTIPNMGVIQGSSMLDYGRTSLANQSKGASQMLDLKLLGVIPVKSTHVTVIQEQQVVPGGTPFGIKLFTKGVMVIDINNIDTNTGSLCPARSAGIAKGDMILSVGGYEVNSNEEIAQIIAGSDGHPLTVELSRDGRNVKCSLTPALSSSDGKYKCGIWVRDSSAGIGTITYYDEKTGGFAGLGHGICDIDTGKIMPLNSGEVCEVKINSIMKGQAGTPGELRGAFASNRPSGELVLNNEAGIFGTINHRPNQLSRVPLALKQDVQTGKATILCTLDDTGIHEYEITIDRIDLNPKTMTKNMMITVTDPALLQKTGGIVQGMSGSPILQNGCLVGAVTHVFVNNPAKGYGIFAENMISYSKDLDLCG